MLLSASIDIAAPPSTVWAIWRDVEHWPAWTPTVSRAEILTPEPFAVGTRVRMHQPKLAPAIWRVTTLDDDPRAGALGFVWVSTTPGMRITGTHRVEARGSGSHAAASIEFAGPLGFIFGRLLRSLSQRYVRIETESLKTESEAREAATQAATKARV